MRGKAFVMLRCPFKRHFSDKEDGNPDAGSRSEARDNSIGVAYSKIKLVNVTADPVSGVKAWLYLRWLPLAPSSK